MENKKLTKRICTIMNKKYKETDLEQCKIVLKNLLDAVPIESKIFGICCHPFTDTAIIPDLTNKDMGNYWNLTIDDDFEKWRNYIFNKIDTKDNIYSLFIMINKPYKLAALKYCKDYLSIYDFSKLQEMCEKPAPLGVGWIAQIMCM